VSTYHVRISPRFPKAALVTGSRSKALVFAVLVWCLSAGAWPVKMGCSSRSAGLAALLDVFTGTMTDGIARNG